MTTTTVATSPMIAVSAIKPHPKNVRRSLGPLTELVESIKSSGVLEPLLLAPGKKDGTYLLVAGHRRLAAAKKAGLKEVPGYVRPDLTDEADQIAAMVIENVHRVDIDPVEEGQAYQFLFEGLNLTVKDIAARTGRGQRIVRDRIKVAKAPEMVREKVISKQLSLADFHALEAFSDEPALYETLAMKIGTNDFDHALQKAKDARAFERDLAKLRMELANEGIVEYDRAERERIVAEASEAGRQVYWSGMHTGRPDGAAAADLTYTIVDYGPKVAAQRVKWFVLAPADDDETTGDGDGSESVVSLQEQRLRREADAERARKQQIRDDLDIAEKLRMKHLKTLVFSADAKQTKNSAVRIVVDRFHEWPDELDLVADFLDVTPTVWGEDETEEEHRAKNFSRVVAAVERLTVEQLVNLHHFVDRADVDDSLRFESGWRIVDVDDGEQQWITELGQVYGYTFSDIEKQMMAEAKADED
ncbi:ParB/RepB/Spo0J family partition protein [Rhodococcus qingshengii]|uniref:ParB/RepB/Spo0J family partition protein n=1 Tax=Rhodococcus qingshengii TaxID=334542 RepID=UPI0010A66170|nr:ParB/RepB/Spo0J family partition protein [Rhodococcus qingshengii]THJ69149.1 ParB/RepB/Spo0J family partition protein [Rhodococcus qingshengii]